MATDAPTKTPTREDVEALKQNWLSDPIWDLGDTQDGYEVYKEELWDFQREWEAKWKAKQDAKTIEQCEKFGCSPAMLRYVENLEYKIKQLQDRLDKIEGY